MKKEDNTALIVLLILLSMGIILFCSYLVYRQNAIIVKESERKATCEKETPNNAQKKEFDQILLGDGSTIVKNVVLPKSGPVCIHYKRENEEKEECFEFSRPVYGYLFEENKVAHLYVILENGTVTEVSLNNNFNIRTMERYHNLKNIIRIYETNESKLVFVDATGKEYQ